MPLMVDLDTGAVVSNAISDPSGSLVSYFSVPAAGPSSATLQTLATDTGTGTAIAATVTAESASATHVNATAVVASEKAEQTSLNATTPLYLMLAFLGILVFCMLIQHPRFLARLFASLPSKRRKNKIDPTYAFRSVTARLGNIEERGDTKVGGGELETGWILRTGTQQTSSAHRTFDEKDDPFASPLDDVFSPKPILQPSPTLSPPPHIAPMLSHLPFASWLLWSPLMRLPRPFASNMKLPYLYVILAYLTLIALALIWKSDVTPSSSTKGYGSDFARTGMVGLSQFPLVVALGVRGNVIGLCVGKGYERLKVLHKIVGRVTLLAVTFHMCFWAHKWSQAGSFWQNSSAPSIAVGFLAWASLVWLAVTSLPWVRAKFYGLFEISHTIGIILLLIGTAMHVKVAVPFCFATGVIYAFSLLCSATKTRLAHAEFVTLPSSATTVVTIPSLRTGWRAGQHVRLRVPALGFPKCLEAHPFTIASAPDGEGMILMCKQAGDWTEALYNLADNGQTRNGPFKATVILEGPYGGLGNTLLPSFSSVLLVAGGSGITHSLSLAHDLIMKAPTGVVRARAIDLVWLVKTEEAAQPLIPTLLDLTNDAKAFETLCLAGNKRSGSVLRPTALRIKIYVTRCPVSSPLTLLSQHEHEKGYGGGTAGDIFDITDDVLQDRSNPFVDVANIIPPITPTSNHQTYYPCSYDYLKPSLTRQTSEAEKLKQSYLSRNPSTSSTTSSSSSNSATFLLQQPSPMSSISVHPSRSDFGGMLSRLADEVIAKSGREMVDPSGMVVVACGPVGMVESVKEGVRGMEGYKCRAVGGVEVEEEVFGF